MLFSKQKTSVRISLLFTLFSSGLFFLFISIFNIYYFYSWNIREALDAHDDVIEVRTAVFHNNPSGYTLEKEFIRAITNSGGIVEMTDGGKYVPKNPEPDPLFLGIYKKEGEWYAKYPVEIPGYKIYFPYNITEHIVEHTSLLFVSLILSVLFLLVTFGVSFFFSRSSLVRVHDILEYITSFQAGKIFQKFPISEPKNDEIIIIGHTLEKAFANIDSQSRIMKQLSADIAHEFRTPLMMMNSELDYMEKSRQYDDGIVHMKQYISGLENLIHSLLILAQVEDGVMTRETVDITQILEKETTIYARKYESKGIELHKNIHKNIHKKTNINMLHIVFANLIENAYKYTNSGRVTITLTNQYFSIADTGMGIDENEQEKIWERFYRVDSARTDVTSYGVGLFLVQKIIEKLGYHITLESTKGKGSLFRIDFNNQED
ncbi:HAMP domain-containing histidine kinase [Candidatus Gracilibacteria bacterium]|nr:HAMP domain-containing histidine kinase [Candidatus Gracilibacteria bacterium]